MDLVPIDTFGQEPDATTLKPSGRGPWPLPADWRVTSVGAREGRP